MLVRILLGATFALIVWRVIGLGFRPQDDALFHSAKAISGKSWHEILVLRDSNWVDPYPGWHAILGGVYGLSRCSVDGLVVFSIVALFLLFALTPIALLRRPEAWALALVLMLAARPGFTTRPLLGRPYVFSMAVLLAMLLLWRRVQTEPRPLTPLIAIFVLVTAQSWIHGNWYLLALPGLALLMARRWRAARRIGLVTALGVLAGACLTGHPCMFLRQTLVSRMFSLAHPQLQSMLPTEFQARYADFQSALAVVSIVIARRIWSRAHAEPLHRNPAFLLCCLGWVLGQRVLRFWIDWGMPAAILWTAQELQTMLASRLPALSWKRVPAAVGLGAVLFVTVTADTGSRWSKPWPHEPLRADRPEHKGLLPEPGGIVYNDMLQTFYMTIYGNPTGPWRYLQGSDATLMPMDDLQTLFRIRWNDGTSESYMPWVQKMRTQDRMILLRPRDRPPNIPGLQWKYVPGDTWVGRVPAGSG